LLRWDGEGYYGGAGFFGGYLAVGGGGRGEGYGFGGEVDGGVHAVQADEVPHVLPESFGAPMDVVAGGFACGEVAGEEVVVDEAGGDGLVRGDGLREEAAAEGERGNIADAGCAFGEEDDGESVLESPGHAFGGFGGAATGSAGDVDGAGHEADPAEDGRLAEFDLGDEDAGTHGGVEEDVDVGEVVGDDGAMGGDGADGGEGNVLGAEEAVADFAEPGGAEGAGLRALDEDFDGGIGEDQRDRENAIDFSKKRQANRSSCRLAVNQFQALC
jgi:hypothetical protein